MTANRRSDQHRRLRGESNPRPDPDAAMRVVRNSSGGAGGFGGGEPVLSRLLGWWLDRRAKRRS